MSRFKYFEDFNEEAMVLLDGASCTEVYLFSLRIFLHSYLLESGQKYISNNYRNIMHKDKDLEIVKFYAAASFHYKKVGDKMGCNEIEASSRYKLFDNVIFPLIPMEALMAIKSENKGTWHWRFSEDMSFLTISRGRTIEEGLFDKLHHLHTDCVENSQNTRTISLKRASSFVEEFKEKEGFDLSRETTLKNFTEFIGYRNIVQNKEILRVSLLKFRSIINENEFMKAKKERVWAEEEERSFDEIRVENRRKKKEFNNKRIGSEFPLDDYIEKGIVAIANNPSTVSIFDSEIDKKIHEEICKHYFYCYIDEADGTYMIEPANLVEWTAPMGFKIDSHYVLVIPITKNSSREPFRYAFSLVSRNPFKTAIHDEINALIWDYYFKYLEQQKNEVLRSLQRELLERHEVSDFQDIEDRLIEVAKEAFKKIVHITDAYSATLRLYRPASRTLKKVVNEQNEEARDTCDSKELTEIDVVSYAKKSLNCRAFLLHNGEQCASYIRDVRVPDVTGFGSIPLRDQTKSELCMPFYYNGVAIGAMNFESPNLRAFDNECKYLDTCNERKEIRFHTAKNLDKCIELRDDSFLSIVKSSLQDFYVMLCERNDTQHLLRLSERETNLHELKNLVESAVTDDTDLNPHKKQILSLLKSDASGVADEPVSAREMLTGIRAERIDAYYGSVGNMVAPDKDCFTQEENLKERLPIYIDEDKPNSLLLSRFQTELKLKAIYKNLLTNYFIHGDKETDTLEVRYFKKIDTLAITQTFKQPLDLSEGKSFYFPIDESSETHSGLFIAGTSVRQLDGYVFADYDESGRLKRFDIHIKLTKFKEGPQ